MINAMTKNSTPSTIHAWVEGNRGSVIKKEYAEAKPIKTARGAAYAKRRKLAQIITRIKVFWLLPSA